MPTRSLLLPLAVFSTAVFAPIAPAQTAAPSSEPPNILLDTVGPDGWRVRLGPTNLGSMLESKPGRSFWEPRVMPLIGLWQQRIGDETAFALARPRMLGYGGRVRVGMWIGAGEKSPDVPMASVAVVIDGDGKTDLGALAADLRKLVDKKWEDKEVGGTRLAVTAEGDIAMCAPLLEGEHLLVAFTTVNDLAGSLARARDLAKTATGKPPAPNSPVATLQIDFATIVAHALASSSKSQQIWLRALGCESLGTGTLTLATAGPHVMFELAQSFTNDKRGLFAAFFPATNTIADLPAPDPKVSPSWKIGHFDLKAAFDAVVDALATDENKNADTLRGDIDKELGIDLAKDLFAHMTDEVMMTGSFREGGDDDPNWSIAFRLRDDAAFEKSLMTMLAKQKPMITRAGTEKHGDIDVHRYSNFISRGAVWLAVGNGVFTIAMGDQAEATIGGTLDVMKDMPKGKLSASEPPAGFDVLKKFLPPGCNGLGKGDIDSIAALPTEMWFDIAREVLPIRPLSPPAGEASEQQVTMAMLKENNLDVIRSATGFADRRWSWRLYW